MWDEERLDLAIQLLQEFELELWVLDKTKETNILNKALQILKKQRERL